MAWKRLRRSLPTRRRAIRRLGWESRFSPDCTFPLRIGDWGARLIVIAVLVTGATGIPLRFYLLSAVGFDFRKLGETFGRLFPVVLAMDQLWAIAPFLLLPKIGIGLAFAATAALLYVPFSERTLVRMAYPVGS